MWKPLDANIHYSDFNLLTEKWKSVTIRPYIFKYQYMYFKAKYIKVLKFHRKLKYHIRHIYTCSNVTELWALTFWPLILKRAFSRLAEIMILNTFRKKKPKIPKCWTVTLKPNGSPLETKAYDHASWTQNQKGF